MADKNEDYKDKAVKDGCPVDDIPEPYMDSPEDVCEHVEVKY